MPARFRVVLIAAPRPKANALAKGLVAARLAGCVNVVPGVVSHYRWKGRIQKDAEALLIAKTSAESLPALKRWVEKNHPYEVAEVLSLPVEDGAAPYLGWLAESLR